MMEQDGRNHNEKQLSLFLGVLEQLKQTNNVKSYRRKSETARQLVISVCKEIPEEYFISCFINGLEDEIGSFVQRCNPRTLSYTYTLAEFKEICVAGTGRVENGRCNSVESTEVVSVIEERSNNLGEVNVVTIDTSNTTHPLGNVEPKENLSNVATQESTMDESLVEGPSNFAGLEAASTVFMEKISKNEVNSIAKAEIPVHPPSFLEFDRGGETLGGSKFKREDHCSGQLVGVHDKFVVVIDTKVLTEDASIPHQWKIQQRGDEGLGNLHTGMVNWNGKDTKAFLQYGFSKLKVIWFRGPDPGGTWSSPSYYSLHFILEGKDDSEGTVLS